MDPQYAESKVAGPAIGLMVVAIIGMLLQLVGAAFNVLGLVGGTAVAIDQGADGIGMLANGAIGLVFNLITLVMGGVIIFGAMKMKSLSSHGAAMAGAIIAMVPCLSPCCPLGLIVGIWALVSMSDPDVKAAFQANAEGDGY